MKKWFNLLLGYAVIQVTGAYPERFLNLCAQNRRGFWRLQWPDAHTVQVRVHLSDLEELKELAGGAGALWRYFHAGAAWPRPSGCPNGGGLCWGWGCVWRR